MELVGEDIPGRSSRTSSSEPQSVSLHRRSPTIMKYRPDPARLAFLEAYLLKLEAPIAVQVWSTLFILTREVLSSASAPSAKMQLYPLLRYVVVFSDAALAEGPCQLSDGVGENSIYDQCIRGSAVASRSPGVIYAFDMRMTADSHRRMFTRKSWMSLSPMLAGSLVLLFGLARHCTRSRP